MSYGLRRSIVGQSLKFSLDTLARTVLQSVKGSEVVTCLIVGAGARGAGAYAPLMQRWGVRLVGVAEPDRRRREAFLRSYPSAKGHVFQSYEECFAQGKLADAVVIATQDQDHIVPATEALRCGYHVLLEKPITNTLSGCLALKRLADDHPQQLLAIGHSLRYTAFFTAIKGLLTSGELGQTISLSHHENVGYYHFAHSFVRGNWRRQELSSPVILAKSCHDTDILLWLVGQPCLSVAAFGGLKHFRRECAPMGAGQRCIDCSVEEKCPFSAKKIYLERFPEWQRHFVAEGEQADQVLGQSPYGRCVYRCDNDVLDHMSVAFQFQGGVSATFSLSAFTHDISRTIKIMCSHGEIRGHLEGNVVEVWPFGSDTPTVLHPRKEGASDLHNGGDERMVDRFCHAVAQGASQLETSIVRSLDSHLLAFAIQQSYEIGQVIDMKNFTANLL